MSESDLSRRIIAYLNQQKGWYAQKRHIGPYDRAGEPDITGIAPGGRRVEIEVKLPGNLPTPHQRLRLDHWRKLDALVTVVWNVADAEAFVRQSESGLYDRT